MQTRLFAGVLAYGILGALAACDAAGGHRDAGQRRCATCFLNP
jgi:hypothetical protein